ncbi:MAG: AMP-binding protein, partial [Chitinophagales bacterium]
MILAKKNETGYKKVNTIKVDIRREDCKDGTIILHSAIPLDPHPYRLTERFKEWATREPDRVFIGRKNFSGNWEMLSYSKAFTMVLHIAQSLLDRHISPLHPIAILSENSIEHALLALAALHVGIPYSSITPAYSLRSSDFNKLKYVVDLLEPQLIFVQDAKKYEKALQVVAKGIEVVAVTGAKAGSGQLLLDELLKTPITS